VYDAEERHCTLVASGVCLFITGIVLTVVVAGVSVARGEMSISLLDMVVISTVIAIGVQWVKSRGAEES
jgi:hypothetical protein